METPFIKHMKNKYPELDIDLILSLVDKTVEDIKPNPLNPDQSVKIFPGSDLNKNLVIKVISDYMSKI
jgi:hypothetical protein